MPGRFTPLDTGFRAYNGSARATITEANDDPMMQEVGMDVMHSDSRKNVERFQSYGDSSVPLPPDQQGNQGGDNKSPAAEAIVSFPGGNRSHPVITGVDDRRHRPYKLKPGEVLKYDDQKQEMYFARDGAYFGSPKKVVLRHTSFPAESPPQPGQQKRGRDMSQQPTATAEVLVENGKVTVKIGGVVKMVITSSKIVLVGPVYAGVDSADEAPTTKLDITDGTPSKQVYSKP